MGTEDARRAIKILPTPQIVAEQAASIFTELANSSVRQQGRFTVALSGGSTPKALYESLAQTYSGVLPWEKIYLFWGDERYVTPEHPDSNYRMVKETLTSKINIPDGNVHPVPTLLNSAQDAADAYEQEIKQFFGLSWGQFPAFDLVLLGLGSDGHTASIFPGTAAVEERSRLAIANYVERQRAFRITLTIPVINNAANVMFLITGSSKASIVYETLAGRFRPREIPAQYIRPQMGKLIYIIDHDAGANLPALFKCILS